MILEIKEIMYTSSCVMWKIRVYCDKLSRGIILKPDMSVQHSRLMECALQHNMSLLLLWFEDDAFMWT